MRRIGALALSATLLASVTGTPEISASAAPKTVLNSVLSEVRPDGTVPKQAALQAFSDLIGPLPGVPEAPMGSGQVLDGTFAVDWALGYWDELSAAQRAAIKRYLPEPPAISATDVPQGRDAFGPHLVAQNTPPAGPYLAVLKNDESDIASHIGHPLGIPVSVMVNSKQVGPTAFAYTYAYDSKGDLTGRPASCVIYINPLLYHSVDSSQVNVTLMHEMFHCFQAVDYPALTAFYDAPKWLIEGSAEWVGETLAPSQPDVLWQNYLLDIGESLFNRTYDAIGFFAHMEETGIDPWHLFDRMFKAPSSAAAYAVATDREFKLTWASSLLRHPDFGDGWDLTGPAIPDVAFNPTVHVLAPNQSLKGTVAAYANDIVGVNTAANTVEFVVSTPYSRLHDSTTHDFDNLRSGPHQFCLNNCTLSAELEALPRLSPGAVYLALTGDTTGASYAISASNDAPCLVGNWVTTDWTLITPEGSVSGGAGIHVTVTSFEVVIDFTGMAPVGDLVFSGRGDFTASYSQSTTATSGPISLTEIATNDITLTVGGGAPISGNSQKSLVHSGSGTWTCSEDTMSWHLSNSTASEVMDFNRVPS
jgi:hypothetical protein